MLQSLLNWARAALGGELSSWLLRYALSSPAVTVMAARRAEGGVTLSVTNVTLVPSWWVSMGLQSLIDAFCKRRRRLLLLPSLLLQEAIWVAPSKDWAVVTLKACK